jgi:succinate-semialdehyde dehydrogenase / glutarate-semialdehyde dehydrogenase
VSRREVRNPSDGSIVGEVEWGGVEDAISACDRAAASFPNWSRSTVRQRADVLSKAATLIADGAERIGLLLSKETGKRLPEGIAEVRFAAEYFRWFAEQARRPIGEIMPGEVASRRHLTTAQAAGVVLALTPWNFPVSIQARKIAPALAAGCTVVARPSERAPLAVREIFECLLAAGLPADVAILVNGPAMPLSEAMIRHRSVRVVSFTGSTEVGRSIMRQAAYRIVRPLLELGGNAPFIVFADADIERAVEGAMTAKFRNNGQSCIAANRFYIESEVFDEFCESFAKRIDSMTIGDPTHDPVPDLGPLIHSTRRDAVNSMISEAISSGARLLTSDRQIDPGPMLTFTRPALLTDLPDSSALACDEVFGPVAGVFRFATEEEVVARANATEMGLAGYLYTGSLDRAWRVGERLEVGILGLNNPLPSVAFAPMGGVKQSGLGREGSHHGLSEFMDIKYFAAELSMTIG